jgi:hypothetical protein
MWGNMENVLEKTLSPPSISSDWRDGRQKIPLLRFVQFGGSNFLGAVIP